MIYYDIFMLLPTSKEVCEQEVPDPDEYLKRHAELKSAFLSYVNELRILLLLNPDFFAKRFTTVHQGLNLTEKEQKIIQRWAKEIYKKIDGQSTLDVVGGVTFSTITTIATVYLLQLLASHPDSALEITMSNDWNQFYVLITAILITDVIAAFMAKNGHIRVQSQIAAGRKNVTLGT